MEATTSPDAPASPFLLDDRSTDAGIKFRLSVMMFLHYAI